MDFKVAQPIAGHQGTQISVTAATFTPYVGITMEDLRFTKELYEMSQYNKNLKPTDLRIYKPMALDILPLGEAQHDMLPKAFAWHIRAILVEHEPTFARYWSQLGLPEAIDKLPVEKTVQFPTNAINVDESQNDGNWEVLKNLLNQVSPSYPRISSMMLTSIAQTNVSDSSLEEYVTLVHGDLSTKERIDALQRMRVIEHNAKNHLSWVLFIPSLFHFKMACTDAFGRIHVMPRAGQDDPMGFFEYIHHMRPRETGKFVSSPGFCCMHDTIHHTTCIDILDC